jgi:hypothetical protein
MRMTGSTHGTQERQNSYEAQSDHHSGTPTKSSRPILVERRWVSEIAYAALVLAAVALIVSPVLRRAGWPLNDGWTSPLILVQIYAAHLRHLDLFPVWSSSDGTGMGSPILLYYQRTFFYVAGLIYLLLGGELKPAVVVTIAIFLMVGAYGMRSALGVITNSRLFSTVGSLGFLFTNYVFTDWFDPRGDLAEFSALMIVPWLLLWCLILLKDRRFSFMLIPVMVLLVNTHSAIALVSLVSLFVALGTFIAIAGFSGLRNIALRLAITVAATTLLLAPLFLAELRFSKFYDPQTKVTAGGFLSTQQFDSFWSYFYGGLHRWLVPPVVPFVQIDFAIWVPIAVALVAAGAYWALNRRGRGSSYFGRLVHMPIMVFLIGSLLVYLFLQMGISASVYRLFPPLQVISFPSVMLSFITPLGIILVVAIADSVRRRSAFRKLWWTLAALWLASLIVLSPISSSLPASPDAKPGQFPSMALFTTPMYLDYQAFSLVAQGTDLLPLYGAFLPKVFTTSGSELKNDIPLYLKLHQHQAGAQSLSQVPCTVIGPSRAPFETLQLRFSVTCSGPTQLALPISYNAYSKVYVVEKGGALHQIPYSRVRTDPRIVIDVTGFRSATLVVHLPTWWGVLMP